jgi:hypothetical protein
MKRAIAKANEEVEEPVVLPLELWGEVFSHLSYNDLVRSCATVCRAWFEDDFLYKCVHSMRSKELIEVDDERLRRMKNISHLELFDDFMRHTITNAGLETLVNLKTLIIISNCVITDEGLKKLTGLTHLSFTSLCLITDEGVKGLTNLRTLRMSTSSSLSKEGIKNLTNLTCLRTGTNKLIDDESIAKLYNLRELDLDDNSHVTGECITSLTALEKLIVAGARNTFDGRYLLNEKVANTLTSLNLSSKFVYEGPQVDNTHLKYLTSLRELALDLNFVIKDEGLSSLCSLTRLNLGRNSLITNAGVDALTTLRKLTLIYTKVGAVKTSTLSTKHGLVIKGEKMKASPMMFFVVR